MLISLLWMLKMDYLLRYKETVMTTIMEKWKIVEKNTYDEYEYEYEYVNNIGFGCGTTETEGITNIIKYTSKNNKTNFMFITSIPITKNNYAEIFLFGRRRWKIENQGFKSQKSKILNIEHCYIFSSNGTVYLEKFVF